MYATIASIEPATHRPLTPAPSVSDWEIIKEDMARKSKTGKALLDGPHEIMASYRGGVVWLDNGAYMYRRDSNAPGANGYLGAPVGEEGCYIIHEGNHYNARVTYTQNP